MDLKLQIYKMNDIAKNTELFVNILSMSRTSAVQKWDHEAFQRAFRWAHYFEQVYKKTKGKPAVAEKIAKQLSTACRETNVKLGLSPIQYDDLPHASLILRKNLLENVHLNNDFYLELAGQLNDPPQQESNYRKQLQAFSKLKATLQILQLIQKLFEARMEKADAQQPLQQNKNSHQQQDEHAKEKKTTFQRSESQIKANAILLRKCLFNVIGEDNASFERKKKQLHVQLSGMIKHDFGLDVLILALILNQEDGNDNVSRYILDFIEDILVVKWKEDWKEFLQFPVANLFGKCGTKFSRFTDLYFDVIKYCGDCLQEAVEKHDCSLLMDKKENDMCEQMYKYYYCLLQNSLMKFGEVSAANELRVEKLVRSKCDTIEVHGQQPQNDDVYIWNKLAQDLMVSFEI